jgi:hypothetical protein
MSSSTFFHIFDERELKGTNVEFAHPYGTDSGFNRPAFQKILGKMQ